MTDSPISKVLEKLYSVTGFEPKRRGTGSITRCPAHNDHNPSLLISEGGDGRVLLKCFAGCSTESIMDALGMPMSLLFPDNGRESQHRPRPQTTPRNAKLYLPRVSLSDR